MRKIMYSMLIVGLVLNSLVTAYGAASTPQQRDGKLAKLVEGAKKEGALSIWSTFAQDDFIKISAPFKARYPFLKVEFWASNPVPMYQKMAAEYRARRVTADFFGPLGDAEAFELKKMGAFMKYDWPNTKDWPAQYKDPEGFYIALNDNANGIAYNSNLVSVKEAPKSFEDILAPKWKGRFGWWQHNLNFFGTAVTEWGEKKAVEYLKRVVDNKPILVQSPSTMTLKLAAGEFPVAVGVYAYLVIRYKEEKKAPVEFVLTEPLWAHAGPQGIASLAPHPNAAKLWADFVTSDEGCRLYSDLKGQHSPNPRVKMLSREGQMTKGMKRRLYGAQDVPYMLQKGSKLYYEIILGVK